MTVDKSHAKESHQNDVRHDVARDVTDNLDVVACRQSLDVSLLKNRLAVKQKGKRQSTTVQTKIFSTRPTQVSTVILRPYKLVALPILPVRLIVRSSFCFVLVCS